MSAQGRGAGLAGPATAEIGEHRDHTADWCDVQHARAARGADPRRESERALLARAVGTGPRELRRAWWTLYVSVRREREQGVRT